MDLHQRKLIKSEWDSIEVPFSKSEIEVMMKNAGFSEIKFSENEPYWHVLGRK